jgi:hypothetical protein
MPTASASSGSAASRLNDAAGFASATDRSVAPPQGLSTHAGLGDYAEALAQLSDAFDELLSDYADRKRTASGSTPYTFGPEHGFGNITARPDSQFTSQLGERVKKLTTVADRFQRAIRVFAVGLNYRRYARFEMLLPRVDYFMDGHREVHPLPGFKASDEEYQFCRQFVIETALHLAEMDFDFDLDLRKVWQEHQAQQWAAQPPAAS